MKHELIILILSCLIIFGCNHKTEDNNQTLMSNKRLLLGTWQLSDLSKSAPDSKEGEDKLLKAADDKKLIKEGLILSFFPDNSFTEIKGTGEYRFGKWNYTNKGKILCFWDSISKDSVLITYETIREQQFMHINNRSKNVNMSFVKYVDLLKDYTQDPFYVSNNSWRIKPTQSETDAELHERLGNYFKHLAYLLNSASERKLPSISFIFSQGIVKIYNGGIGVLPIIPESWEKTYYNSEEALDAYDMFREYLSKSSYGGAGTGDWYKDDYDILTSIYGDVKAGKFPKRKNK